MSWFKLSTILCCLILLWGCQTTLYVQPYLNGKLIGTYTPNNSEIKLPAILEVSTLGIQDKTYLFSGKLHFDNQIYSVSGNEKVRANDNVIYLTPQDRPIGSQVEGTVGTSSPIYLICGWVTYGTASGKGNISDPPATLLLIEFKKAGCDQSGNVIGKLEF